MVVHACDDDANTDDANGDARLTSSLSRVEQTCRCCVSSVELELGHIVSPTTVRVYTHRQTYIYDISCEAYTPMHMESNTSHFTTSMFYISIVYTTVGGCRYRVKRARRLTAMPILACEATYTNTYRRDGNAARVWRIYYIIKSAEPQQRQQQQQQRWQHYRQHIVLLRRGKASGGGVWGGGGRWHQCASTFSSCAPIPHNDVFSVPHRSSVVP